MAIFPVSPTVGQEETVLGRTFVYDGYGWVVKVSGGHIILDPAGDTMPTQPALQFGAGFTVTDETAKTLVVPSNPAALPNLETAANATQPTINEAVNDRLFEQIAFVLSGYDIAVTTDSQDILKALPYAFKAYEIRAEFATAPTGSSAIVTFYKNGVSIGATTILSSEFVGTTVLDPVVSFAKGDSLSAVVTQIGMTIPGATAKAYIQGIKYQ